MRHAYTSLKHPVERAARHAGVGLFGIADDAGFVDVLGSQPNVSSGRDKTILARNTFGAPTGNLTPILCRVIFVGEPTLCQALDFECIGQCAIDGGMTPLWAFRVASVLHGLARNPM